MASPEPPSPVKAVEMWYSEIEFTKGGLTGGPSECTGTCGHYTQVVWADSSTLGCGAAGNVVVCQYGEGGNMLGQFSDNVLAPTKSAAECTPPPPAPEDVPEKPAAVDG